MDMIGQTISHYRMIEHLGIGLGFDSPAVHFLLPRSQQVVSSMLGSIFGGSGRCARSLNQKL